MATERVDSGSSETTFTLAFWNVNRLDRRELINRLAVDFCADAVALLEHGAESDATLDGLRRHVDESFNEPVTKTRRIQLFARRPACDLHEIYGDASGRVTIRVMQFQDTEFLFAAVHLPSKIYWTREDQTAEVQVLANQIRRVEDDRGHRRTVLFGDLNMNPFEDGIVQASGLHAMSTRRAAAAGNRVVQGREYPFFYNPMWGFFGDRTEGPPGTYFFDGGSGRPIWHQWNMFDQVSNRPEALPWFQGDVRIVTRIGETELADGEGRPDRETGSDHFPIVFRLAARP